METNIKSNKNKCAQKEILGGRVQSVLYSEGSGGDLKKDLLSQIWIIPLVFGPSGSES